VAEVAILAGRLTSEDPGNTIGPPLISQAVAPAPASFHHHGTAQLPATTGRILLQDGYHSNARDVLTAAVGNSYLTGRRQRV
jgi:hypothetical protein